MLGAHVVVVPTFGFLPRLYQGTAYPAGKVVSAQKCLLVAARKILPATYHRKEMRRKAMFLSALLRRENTMGLTSRETTALQALADTFFPSLAFERDEDPVLFSMSAADLDVGTRVAETLDQIDP